jgi:hypothetical protein
MLSRRSGLVGSSATVSLEIEVTVRDGVWDDVARTVTEHARTLTFGTEGFESE